MRGHWGGAAASYQLVSTLVVVAYNSSVLKETTKFSMSHETPLLPPTLLPYVWAGAFSGVS